MWTSDSLNSANADQLVVLESVMGVGGAAEDTLLQISQELENLGSPYVACCAKLPFGISVDQKSRFSLPAGRDGCEAILTFSHFKPVIGRDLTVRYEDCIPNYGSVNGPIGTQVLARLSLWGRHRRYHRNYCSSISARGLIDQPLDTPLWGTKRAPAGYDGEAMLAHRYESETTRAVFSAFHRVIDLFIRNYNISALDCLNCPEPGELSGFFAMLAPGRITFMERPHAPVLGMISKQWMPHRVSSDLLLRALRFSNRELDRYLNQLLAMQSLARSGEFALAVIGCVTAIEWFLNELLLERKERNTSIRVMKPRDLSIALPSDIWSKLRSIAHLRNSAVHGAPPSRAKLGRPADKQNLNDVIETGLNIYREAQRQLKLGPMN